MNLWAWIGMWLILSGVVVWINYRYWKREDTALHRPAPILQYPPDADPEPAWGEDEPAYRESIEDAAGIPLDERMRRYL